MFNLSLILSYRYTTCQHAAAPLSHSLLFYYSARNSALHAWKHDGNVILWSLVTFDEQLFFCVLATL